ncbi:MAG: ATP-binding cassette domain-containing protein, partial [Candidatus Lokiarchaeota archaeon]|nr:ATP-binding cassette domain-containing protein [Candidatus Lokiarchaeota archaeon]
MIKESRKLLKVKHLRTQFFTEEGVVKAVDDVSFDIFRDEILGLVGETGCGKSVTALSILQLIRSPGKIVDGEIYLNEINLLELSKDEIREIRGRDITMIFQDPLNSLNPVIKVGEQISEVFLLHQKEKLNRELDNRKLERDKRKAELDVLKDKLDEEAERLSIEEKRKLQAKINELKRKTKHIPTIKDVLQGFVVDIISAIGIADAEGIV